MLRYIPPVAATFFLICICFTTVYSQTGPNSPQTRANDASIGSNAWSNPNQIINSNNGYATVSTKGITNYISGTNFNFAISVPSAINGIVLEVERSTSSPTAVAVLNNWTTSMTRTISPGTSRCLIAAVLMENGSGPRDVTAMTYGGQSLTQITESFVGASNGFCGKIEYWRLMESGIAAATNSSFVLTFATSTLTENWEALSSAVYQYVDQVIPVSSISNFTSNSATNPITLSPALATQSGGMSISGAFCGNNTTPAASIGGTNTYLINSGFTEVIDTYSANTGFSTSGGCFQIAHKASTAIATEAPTYTFAGTANRQLASAIHLQSLREADNSVRLIKGGAITGSDFAQTTAAWPTTDTYTTYGGPTNLWGTTWTDSDINSTTFGAVLSASVQNGTAQVDHMRITIYSQSTLPIELMDFYGENKDGINYIYWQTITEKNNKVFELERSTNGTDFLRLGNVNGKGNSQVVKSYEFVDKNPPQGLSYYRLKQVDFDGSFKYHKIIVLRRSDNSEDLIVYPNPSCEGIYNIRTNVIAESGVNIYDVNLKLVKQCDLISEDYTLTLNELAEGDYFLIYTVGDKQKIKRLSKNCRSN
ncbi:MAG: T9SS type A sorting domain-containing protein [Bacteroidia bacterium]|nr:T9SS type A sorting domain-containing protein [Bacteroidia bacterium]